MEFITVYKTMNREQVSFVITIKEESWKFSEGNLLTSLLGCRPNFFKCYLYRKVPDHRVDDIMNRKRKLFLYIRRK